MGKCRDLRSNFGDVLSLYVGILEKEFPCILLYCARTYSPTHIFSSNGYNLNTQNSREHTVLNCNIITV